MELNFITSKIIAAAINVHKELGPGLLETVYQSCLGIEMKNNDMKVDGFVKSRHSGENRSPETL